MQMARSTRHSFPCLTLDYFTRFCVILRVVDWARIRVYTFICLHFQIEVYTFVPEGTPNPRPPPSTTCVSAHDTPWLLLCFGACTLIVLLSIGAIIDLSMKILHY